jgi:superoxide dismutase, Cu-Zn family
MKAILSIAVAGIFVAACASMPPETGLAAVAKLEPTKGNNVKGTVTFTQAGENRVRVNAQLEGLKPDGEHGFHVHEKGDCSSGDGMSAGGHFNPSGKPHGPQAGDHHAGDMPNLRGDGYGNASAAFEISGNVADLVGHGLIVHRDADDYKTQPTGNSGPRIACAVITKG